MVEEFKESLREIYATDFEENLCYSFLSNENSKTYDLEKRHQYFMHCLEIMNTFEDSEVLSKIYTLCLDIADIYELRDFEDECDEDECEENIVDFWISYRDGCDSFSDEHPRCKEFFKAYSNTVFESGYYQVGGIAL